MKFERLEEIKETYEHMVWRNDTESELLQVIGELVNGIEHLINALLNRELLQADINTLEDIKTTLLHVEKRLKFDINESELVK